MISTGNGKSSRSCSVSSPLSITGGFAKSSIFNSSSIGLFSFIIEDSNPLYWLYSKFLLVLGTVFPIEYFPKVIQSILVYTPIYVTCYGPAKLFVDFSWGACLNILVSQFIYVFIACFICYAIYQKGVKKLNVNGG